MTEHDSGEEPSTLGFAIQGMALWHLVLGAPFLVLLTVLLLTAKSNTASSEGDGYGFGVLVFGVLAIGALVVGLVFAGLSWAILGREFLRPRWSLILIPGLVGTLTSAVTAFIGWPISELIGAWVAYRMVNGRPAASR